MKKNFKDIEKEAEEKYKKRDKKKKPKMRVSGKQVLGLKKIIEKR